MVLNIHFFSLFVCACVCVSVCVWLLYCLFTVLIHKRVCYLHPAAVRQSERSLCAVGVGSDHTRSDLVVVGLCLVGPPVSPPAAVQLVQRT